MKKISLLFAIAVFLATALPLISIAQQTNHKTNIFKKQNADRKQNSVYQSMHRGKQYPHLAMVYDWNMGSNIWELGSAERYLYHPDGKNMITYTLAPDFSDTTFKETTLYDAYGYETYFGVESKTGPSTWQMFYGNQSLFTYYAPAKIETRTDQFWEGNINDWMSYTKTTYTHNGAGLPVNYIEQEWDTAKSIWKNTYKYEFLYDGNNKNNEMISYFWYNNSWQAEERILITWDVFNPYILDERNIDSAEIQIWDTVAKQYVKEDKIKVSRDANGGYVSTYYLWDNASWVLSSRSSEIYDNSKNQTGFVDEEWNGAGWDTTNNYNYLLTYVSGNVTEKIERLWQQGDPAGVFTNISKYVYSDFNSMKKNEQIHLKVYPQPIDQYLIVEIPESLYQNTVIQITDLNGKIMMSQKLQNSTSQIKLDVSVLASGSYILTLQTSDAKVSKLIVKQ